MSRTDKTRPYWVKVLESTKNHIDQHDHRDGICDLGAVQIKGGPKWSWWSHGGSCGYTETATFLYSNYARCGCPMCSGQFDRRQERRQSRRKAKTDSLRWRDEFNASGDIEEWWA